MLSTKTKKILDNLVADGIFEGYDVLEDDGNTVGIMASAPSVTIFALPPLDFMQPELLDEDRAQWDVAFTVDQLVGPSGYTTVVVSGTRDELMEWLIEYTDEDQELADTLFADAKPVEQ